MGMHAMRNMCGTRLWAVLAAGALMILGASSGLGAETLPKSGKPEAVQAAAARSQAYVSSEACKECHEKEYLSYKIKSKMADSFASVKKMRHAVTDAEMKKCYECHTTGYGKPGGFVSERDTPQMAEAGCEVCHGPGALHAQSQSRKDIKGKLEDKDCELCHNPERVNAFRFRALLYGGGH